MSLKASFYTYLKNPILKGYGDIYYKCDRNKEYLSKYITNPSNLPKMGQKQKKPLSGLGQKPGKETTMKYTITMTKNEMKNLFSGFAALSKTILNAILPQISEDYAEVLSKTDISFNDFVDKLTSGGMSNKDFTIEYIVHKDTITVNVEMDIKLMLKVLSFYKKFLADIIPYIVAFCKKHEDELDDLSELLSSRAEAMTEALMEMIEDFDMDALQASAWGCFKEALNPTADTSADDSDDSFEDICKTTDEMLDDIVAKAIEAIDAASDKEVEMHRFGNAVASTLSDMDADTALYLTKQIFGRIIEHYEEQEKMSKEEELERKYHKKNTEE